MVPRTDGTRSVVGSRVASALGGGHDDRKEVPWVVDVVMTLSVRDLTQEDLRWCSWSGSALHLTQVARELERARTGIVDYLAVCPRSDLPNGWATWATTGN